MFSVLACFIWNHLISIYQESGISADHEDLRGIFSQLHKVVAFHIPSSSMQERIREYLLQVGIRHFRPKQNPESFYPAGTFTLVCRVPEVLAKILCVCWFTEKVGLHVHSNLRGKQGDTHRTLQENLVFQAGLKTEPSYQPFLLLPEVKLFTRVAVEQYSHWTLSSGRRFVSICLSWGKCYVIGHA